MLRSTAVQTQRLAIDYAVHHVKAGGHTTAKVFKGWVITLAPGEARLLDKKHPIKPITTRRQHAGTHAVDVRINGGAQALATFELQRVGAQHSGATALPKSKPDAALGGRFRPRVGGTPGP